MVKKDKPIVAIFGGSFDPPHLGHQRIAKVASRTLSIDKLIVLPAFLNPFKTSSFAPASSRSAWCHTLFNDNEKIIVEDYEIKEGKSTTTEQSVKHFNKRYDVKYLIVGSDNLENLTKWHNFEWLNSHITWVIVTRAGYPVSTEALKNWKVIELDESISSTHIRTTHDLHYVDNKIKKEVEETLKGHISMTIETRIENLVEVLDDKKAEEIEVFNLDNADYIAKRVIIANSLNGKHTVALFDHLKQHLKTTDESFLASDVSDDWVVGDLGDILVHIMIPEYRQRYSLEAFLSELIENQKNKA